MTQTLRSFGKMAYCLGESSRNQDVSEDSRLFFLFSAERLYLRCCGWTLWHLKNEKTYQAVLLLARYEEGDPEILQEL